jgi:hypothetical protein
MVETMGTDRKVVDSFRASWEKRTTLQNEKDITRLPSGRPA